MTSATGSPSQHLPSDDAPSHCDLRLQSDYMAYGRQSSAYFLFQPGVQTFIGSSGARVHFARQDTPFGAINFVVNNPLCPRDKMGELMAEFDASQSVPNIYVAVDSQVAEPLREAGYYINELGVESKVNTADFSLRGKRKKQLRHASHFGERSGCRVLELPWHKVDAEQVENISINWIHTKVIHNREIRYSTRPAVFGDEWQVRKFYCLHGDTIVGYVFFDPYYENGSIKGYCANILRALPDKRWNGALDFTVLEALKVFREEGIQELSLGVSPFYNIQADPNERTLVRWISKWFYEHGNRFYAFKSLAYHKSRYRPIETTWYLCMKDVSLARAYWGLLFGLKALGKKEL